MSHFLLRTGAMPAVDARKRWRSLDMKHSAEVVLGRSDELTVAAIDGVRISGAAQKSAQ